MTQATRRSDDQLKDNSGSGSIDRYEHLLPFLRNSAGIHDPTHSRQSGGLYDPAPNGYSHAVVASGVRRIVMIAGQGGEEADGTLSPRFADQVKQAYANLQRVLAAVGAAPGHVAKLTTYVVGYDQSLLPVMTEGVKAVFGTALPAQTLVPVPRLALDGMLFEVEAVVMLD